MTDNQLLERSSLEAIRSAAEAQRGPSSLRALPAAGAHRGHPFRAGTRGGDGRSRAEMTAVTQEYLDFLEDEMRLCRSS